MANTIEVIENPVTISVDNANIVKSNLRQIMVIGHSVYHQAKLKSNLGQRIVK